MPTLKKFGEEPVYLTRAERRMLNELIRHGDKLLDLLRHQQHTKSSSAKPKSRSVRDEHLAKFLARLAHERTQAALAADLDVTEKALRRWIKTQQFGQVSTPVCAAWSTAC